MKKNNDLSVLRMEIAGVRANMRDCERAYRGIKAYRGNQKGLKFSAAQLLQATAALREGAEHLAAIAEQFHEAFSDMPEQLNLDDVSMNGRA
jgi:hypothetical protein